jgi:hypothetical protein
MHNIYGSQASIFARVKSREPIGFNARVNNHGKNQYHSKSSTPRVLIQHFIKEIIDKIMRRILSAKI